SGRSPSQFRFEAEHCTDHCMSIGEKKGSPFRKLLLSLLTHPSPSLILSPDPACASHSRPEAGVQPSDDPIDSPKPTNSDAPPRRGGRALAEAVIASTVGTTIEWYDFFLYGTAAIYIFPKVFFPEVEDFAAQIMALSTYTVGFIARPLGGIIF